MDEPQQSKPRTTWNSWVPLGILVAIALIAIGANIGPNETTPTAVRSPTPTTTAQAFTAAPPPAAAAPTGPAVTFGDGTHIVGVDIQPGTYRSSGAQEGFFEFCSYTRLKEASSDSDALSFGAANANEPIVITIKPSDGAFQAAGCNPFTKVG